MTKEIQDMPGLDFDYGEDATPAECVPISTVFRWNDPRDAHEGFQPEDGSVKGLCPGADDGSRGDYNRNTPWAAPESKPDAPSATPTRAQRKLWNRRSCAKFDFRSQKCRFPGGTEVEDFEDLTIGELQSGFEHLKKAGSKPARSRGKLDLTRIAPPESGGAAAAPPESGGAAAAIALAPEIAQAKTDPWSWIDEAHIWKHPAKSASGDGDLLLWEEPEDKPVEVLGFSWRSKPDGKWVKIKSVVDSSASVPVAPPSMLPNVVVKPSEGSKRGQKFTSASKHKLKHLGEQRARAFTEQGEPAEVLFQVADVSKPLVLVSAICERSSHVIFGQNGGIIQNMRSGSQTPFYREKSVYVVSIWLLDGDEDEQGFGRP